MPDAPRPTEIKLHQRVRVLEIAFDDGALVIHTDEIGHGHQLEVEPERVHPEPVGVLGIADGDMPGDPLGQAETTHDAQARRQPLLAVESFGLEVDVLLGSFEVDAFLVGLEGPEIRFLGVGHGARVGPSASARRAWVSPGRLVPRRPDPR